MRPAPAMTPFPIDRVKVTLFAIAVSVATCGIVRGNDSETKGWVESTKEEPAGTSYHTFRSDTLDHDASYLLYLPPAYEKDEHRRFPVVYWLYGLGSDQRGGAGFVKRLDAAIRDDKAPQMIAVLVNGPPSTFFCDSPHDKVPAETVIVKDLIPHIDASYRTVAERKGRAVEGFSMGGFGAAHLGFKFPETFGVVSILAGALHTTEEFAEKKSGPLGKAFGGDADYFEANSPWTLLRENSGAIRDKVTVRVVIGEDDGLYGGNKAFRKALERRDVEVEFDAVPGVGHDYKKLYDKLGDKGFRFFEDAFRDVGKKQE